MHLCRLHYGLYLIANAEGIVPFNAETIRQRLFPNEAVNVAVLIGILEKAGVITLEGDPLAIRLIEWPQLGKCKTARKGEKLQDIKGLFFSKGFAPTNQAKGGPETISTEEKRRQFRSEKNLKKAGLISYAKSPAFLAFLKAWGPLKHPRMAGRAEQQWKILERSHNLPDIGIILLALRRHPPAAKAWPSTWLRQKPWQEAHRRVFCHVCHDEGIVYGTSEKGVKGALPCPKCAQT